MNRSTLLMRLYTRQIAVTMTHLYRVLAGRRARPEHLTRQAPAENWWYKLNEDTNIVVRKFCAAQLMFGLVELD